MCDEHCLAFGNHLTEAHCASKLVLEVGALNVNGSLRERVEAFGPTSYLGVDMSPGNGVDLVLPASRMVEIFGTERFDLVISTEMLEHVRDWRDTVDQMKKVLRPHGFLLLTTRAPGFHYHEYPEDHWRFTAADLRKIFGDFHQLACHELPNEGVAFFGQKMGAVDLSTITVASVVR